MNNKMTNKTENKIECIGCNSYYLYYSRKKNDYIITSNALEAIDEHAYIELKDEKVSYLIKLLQKHESVLEKNKANLSESKPKAVIFNKSKAARMLKAIEKTKYN